MVYQALDAQLLTSNSITSDNESDVQLELTLAESKIRNGAGNQQYFVVYNATILGNPLGDPNISSNLTTNQSAFYTLLINAGYNLSLDPSTSWWNISWAKTGAEVDVAIYTFRTTFTPSAIITNTINVIKAYFASLIPIVSSTVSYNGFINESGFGGTPSTFYEFTIVANQGSNTTDYSIALKASITAQGLGYNVSNCNVYQLTT